MRYNYNSTQQQDIDQIYVDANHLKKHIQAIINLFHDINNHPLKETVLFLVDRNIDNDIIIYTVKHISGDIFIPKFSNDDQYQDSKHRHSAPTNSKNQNLIMYKTNKHTIQHLYSTLPNVTDEKLLNTNSNHINHLNEHEIPENNFDPALFQRDYYNYIVPIYINEFSCYINIQELIPDNKINRTWSGYSDILPYKITLYPRKNDKINVKTYFRPNTNSRKLEEFSFINICVIITNGKLDHFNIYGKRNGIHVVKPFQISKDLKIKYNYATILKSGNGL